MSQELCKGLDVKREQYMALHWEELSPFCLGRLCVIPKDGIAEEMPVSFPE